MKLTRRKSLMIGSGALLAQGLTGASAASALFDAEIDAITGGAEVPASGVTLILPEVAEDGFTVPVEIDAPGAVAITLLAEDNPAPRVAQFRFGPLSATRQVRTRIRLARSQRVVALAEMADGSLQKAEVHVDVTVGGCGA